MLIGLMGSGKTTVGRRVASRLGVPFVDTDTEIERRTDRLIAEIFATDGEKMFRGLEADVLAQLLADGEPCVLASGGGIVVTPANRRLLIDRAAVVWLKASPGMLAQRVHADGRRPLLGDDARASLERLAAEREPFYAEVADEVVDVDHLDRRLVVERVLRALTGLEDSLDDDSQAHGATA